MTVERFVIYPESELSLQSFLRDQILHEKCAGRVAALVVLEAKVTIARVRDGQRWIFPAFAVNFLPIPKLEEVSPRKSLLEATVDVDILGSFQKLVYECPTQDQEVSRATFCTGCDVFIVFPTGSG